MNFPDMKAIEPELARLEQSAENAGRHQADWMATLLAIHERLSKLAGHGNHVAHVCVRHVPLASRQSTPHDRHLPNTGQRGRRHRGGLMGHLSGRWLTCRRVPILLQSLSDTNHFFRSEQMMVFRMVKDQCFNGQIESSQFPQRCIAVGHGIRVYEGLGGFQPTMIGQHLMITRCVVVRFRMGTTVDVHHGRVELLCNGLHGSSPLNCVSDHHFNIRRCGRQFVIGALWELAPPRDGKTLNPRSIGMKLHHLRHRVIAGRFLDRRDRPAGVIWSVATTEAPGTTRTKGTTFSPSRGRSTTTHTRTHAHVEGAENSPLSPISPTPDPADCFHDWVDTNNGDGRTKRTCRLCGEFYGYMQEAQQ